MAVTPINPADPELRLANFGNPASVSVRGPFSQVLDHLLGHVRTEQVRADETVRHLMLGRVDNVHDVTIAVAKADLAFRLVLEIRNRLTEAYQEITRMQV